MEVSADRFEMFSFEGRQRPVRHQGSSEVTEGVRCDAYAFTDSTESDLGVITIAAGCATPRQKVVGGQRTVEGFLSGCADLRVEAADGLTLQRFTAGDAGRSVVVPNGAIMQWVAEQPSTVFEVCFPPYEDGRFEDQSR